METRHYIALLGEDHAMFKHGPAEPGKFKCGPTETVPFGDTLAYPVSEDIATAWINEPGESARAGGVRLTADVVLVDTRVGDQPYVLLIQRGHEPHKGKWALPGGHVDEGETTVAAAHRELTEETGLVAERLDLIGVYADPERDPRGRYVTFAYLGAGSITGTVPEAADDAVHARWCPVTDLDDQVAFDHHSIIVDALRLLPARESAGGATVPDPR